MQLIESIIIIQLQEKNERTTSINQIFVTRYLFDRKKKHYERCLSKDFLIIFAARICWRITIDWVLGSDNPSSRIVILKYGVMVALGGDDFRQFDPYRGV